MPSVFTHPAVPLAAALALGSEVLPWRLVAVGAALSLLPDLDVLAFRLGVPYGADFGHRGASHSLALAAALSTVFALFHRRMGVPFARAWLFLVACAASHAVMDAFTDGGRGVALFWPWSAERFFAALRPIEAAPLASSRFFSGAGLRVLFSELLWVWLPLLSAAALWRALSSRRRA
ncbi:Inner membrane protein YbcI [Fundidesulfovibrio magnetotacticus]|uniref:Inner membrane protein YbcI n=1 Tax=Fundidesulfovibrio magnetotacticus TaxID=2730080 RepID=A0A6V8LUT0_9BACT|nr:metal-dependent hydrolase [Fundidesulfovibrio magnetotacticus]GFK95494.1 Inner membrane protein YbcI [Fundidesulfovibrio magnetotacticus]